MSVRRLVGTGTWLALAAGLTVIGAREAAAQELGERVRRAPDGMVRFAAAARPDICGDGRSTTLRSGGHEGWRRTDPRWECGILRVAVRVADGRVRELRARVGGGPAPDIGGRVTEVGRVPAPAAGRFFIDLARSGPEAVSEGAVFPAAVVDSFAAWPGLLELARDRERPGELREKAIFWVAQAAADRAAGPLEAIAGDPDDDDDIREHAVFALSQLDGDAGVPALIRIVRARRDPRIVRKALFWLGQSEDPRALAFFEEILVGG